MSPAQSLFLRLPALLALALAGALTAAADPPPGPHVVPIYVDSATNFSPNRYTIYAGLAGGNSPNSTIVPYNFDTGAPNLFSTLGGEGQTPTSSFAFAQGLAYNYYPDAVTVTLGTKLGQPVVSTAAPVNVASVVSITDGGNTSFTHNNVLADGTYGDFGAGLYGNSTLATVLAQLPLGPGLLPGYSVNVAGVSAGNGTLTIGLTPQAVAAAAAAPGAIVMTMSFSGSQIPLGNGTLVNGYGKAQVANATVTLTNPAAANVMPLVLDTGGGANVVIYSQDFGPDSDGTRAVNLAYDGQTILDYAFTTPYGGNVVVTGNVSDGTRINPGGAAIYDNYEVMFVLSTDGNPGQVILVPQAVPEPGATALFAAAAVGAAGLLLRRRKDPANGR